MIVRYTKKRKYGVVQRITEEVAARINAIPPYMAEAGDTLVATYETRAMAEATAALKHEVMKDFGFDVEFVVEENDVPPVTADPHQWMAEVAAVPAMPVEGVDPDQVRSALLRMINKISNEWGNDTADPVTEWAEVFDLGPVEIAWLKDGQ